ncbi:chaperonin 10-like protein [Lasiosphaeria hispida]|uniref:Chaperonin 10-like protein n=1 Tax=Lasiosphaeria hispida TaxID=260671 RepID=A0AAJ0HQL0_9PEZI|nr:chaperonin 10-like protein [Lasiosphaeria hispida]
MTSPIIPPTMLAAQVQAYNAPYVLTTVPVPTNLGPHDLLIKVAAASHCHTDAMVRAGTFSTPLPCTGSHEGAGTVVRTGSAVTAFRAGDRVMCGLPLEPCGACADCTGPENQTHYCAHTAGAVGVVSDGCFAEYVRADARSSTAVPDTVSLVSAAPLACAGRTVWRAVGQVGLGEGRWLAIVGSGGGLGHIGIQFAKKRGLRVIGIDARDEGLVLSKEAGADVVIDARKGKEQVVKKVHEVTGEQAGADATITLADADSAAALACAVTRMHGTMLQIAQPTEVKIPFHEFIFRDIRVRGSVLCSPGESRQMMDFIALNGIDVKGNLFYGLEKIHDLVEKVELGKIQGKAIIIVDEEQIRREKELGAKF